MIRVRLSGLRATLCVTRNAILILDVRFVQI